MLSRISKSESGTASGRATSGTGTDTASTVEASTAKATNNDMAGNNGMAGTGNTVEPVFYLVRKSWDKPNTQIAAFTKIENAENCVNCNPGYAAFDETGNQVYPCSPNKPNKL